jgi:hypothetical protein
MPPKNSDGEGQGNTSKICRPWGLLEGAYTPSTLEAEAEEPEFELSLGYIMSLNYIWRPCLKKKKKVNSKTCHWDQASGRIIRRRGPTLGWVRDPGRYKQGVGKRAVFRGQG